MKITLKMSHLQQDEIRQENGRVKNNRADAYSEMVAG